MKKVLYVATSDIHLNAFHKPYIHWLYEQGHQIDIAIENRGNYKIAGVNRVFEINFPRSLLKRELISSYKQLRGVIEQGNYNLIHCHTPIPSMLTRIAARKERKKGTKVLYTAHGFHFYKGAPLKSWLFYYTAEYFLSQYTDGIITMNREDFGRVNTKMMHKATFYIPGMGVDKNIFYPVSTPTKSILRNRYGFKEDEILIIYIAEFISRKNHEFIIESTVHIKKRLKNFRILFAGKGVLHDRMKQKTKNLGLDDVIVFLGFRNDIPDLIRISDIGISASKHEGLPIGILQELFSGLPVVVSVERGHNDLVDNAKNGYLFAQNDSNDFAEKIIELSINPQERIEMGVNSMAKAKNFELSNSLSAMQEIYNIYLKN